MGEREKLIERSSQMMQRSWEEEAANIRAHMKRFQDTFSKSLSFERESRQRDMKMLLSTIDKCKQAVSESAMLTALPQPCTEDPQRLKRMVHEPSDGVQSVSQEVV